MQADFARWYEAVSLQADAALLEARWKSVQAVAQTTSRAQMEALVRLAFRSRHPSGASEVAAIRTEMTGETGNPPGDEELCLLAAAALAQLLQKGEANAATAATLVTTTSMGGMRPVQQPMDLVGLAAGAIASQAESSRRRPPIGNGTAAPTTVNSADAIANAKTFDAAHMEAAFTALAAATSTALAGLTRRQQTFEQSVIRHVRIQDEELDMLWWLQGGRSFSMDTAFANIPQEQRPLVLAQELAAITFALPGPIAIAALLARAGTGDVAPTSVVTAVQSVPLDWLKRAIPEDRDAKVSPITTPIHEAIKRRLEVHGEDTWMAVWASVCEVDQATQLSAARIAELVYREHLLIRLD